MFDRYTVSTLQHSFQPRASGGLREGRDQSLSRLQPREQCLDCDVCGNQTETCKNATIFVTLMHMFQRGSLVIGL